MVAHAAVDGPCIAIVVSVPENILGSTDGYWDRPVRLAGDIRKRHVDQVFWVVVRPWSRSRSHGSVV